VRLGAAGGLRQVFFLMTGPRFLVGRCPWGLEPWIGQVGGSRRSGAWQASGGCTQDRTGRREGLCMSSGLSVGGTRVASFHESHRRRRRRSLPAIVP
jgi:hypothetical protein